MKAAILRGLPTDWLSPSVLSVSLGLKNPRDLSFRLRDFTFALDVPRLMTAVSLRGEFRTGDLLSPLLLLRVPSETIQLRLPLGAGAIADYSPQKRGVVVGGGWGCLGVWAIGFVGEIGGAPILSAKFPRRRNIRPGCINRRPLMRSEMEELARATWPVRTIWLRIIDGTPMREPLPPSVARSDLTGISGGIRTSPDSQERVNIATPPTTATTVSAGEQRAEWSWAEFQNAGSRRPAVGPA